MSLAAREWAAAQALPSDERAVLSYLAGIAGQAGETGPSQTTIAAFTHLSTDQVRKALSNLRYRNRITWTRGPGPGHANVYTLNIAGPTQPTLTGIREDTP